VSAGPRHYEGCTCEQGPEKLPDGNIEAVRRFLQDPVCGSELESILHPQKPVHNPLVSIRNALGNACGARGIDCVRKVLAPDLTREVGLVLVLEKLAVPVETKHVGSGLRQAR
jgi:hypothetical protein